jgi:hypothetical protein
MASCRVRTPMMKIVKIFELNFPVSRSTASSFEWTFVELTEKEKKAKRYFSFNLKLRRRRKFSIFIFFPH